MDRLVLSLLGGFRARLESGAPVIMPTKRGQALLAYLACSPAESYSRDHLASIFWGDLPQRHTRHSLRQTLYVLRVALASSAPSVLRGDATSVSLERSGLVVDAVDFERLAAMGTARSLEQAGALYQGAFLAGIGAGDLAFEDWLREERDRLQGLAVRAYTKLADLQSAVGLTERAIRSAERVLAIDPAEEPVHRMLIRLYLAMGQPGAARRQYERCARTLQREFGVEPDAETQNLLREISSARASASLSPGRRNCLSGGRWEERPRAAAM